MLYLVPIADAKPSRDRYFPADGQPSSGRCQRGFNETREPECSFVVGALAAEAGGERIAGSVASEFAAAIGISLGKMAGSRGIFFF